MTIQLYEGCWGVTQGGEVLGPMGKSTDPTWKKTHPFQCEDGRTYRKDGSYSADVSVKVDSDIIAVFPTEPEAKAYLAGNPPLKLPPADEALIATLDMLANERAPKPVTWPDGVEGVTTEYEVKLRVVGNHIHVHSGRGFSADDARHLAALLIAAADHVEGRG